MSGVQSASCHYDPNSIGSLNKLLTICPLDVTILLKGSYCVIVTKSSKSWNQSWFIFSHRLIGTFVKGLSNNVKKLMGWNAVIYHNYDFIIFIFLKKWAFCNIPSGRMEVCMCFCMFVSTVSLTRYLQFSVVFRVKVNQHCYLSFRNWTLDCAWLNVFSPLQNVLDIDRITLTCIFSKLADMFLKCWHQSSIEEFDIF